jgi:cell division protein ZipA
VPELRWILLGVGVALILGLWWWETRKARGRALAESGHEWPHERAEPQVDESSARRESAPDLETPVELPYVPVIERTRAPRRPPVIEIPEDFEVDVSAYVGKDRRHAPDPGTISLQVLDPGPAPEPEPADVRAQAAEPAEAAAAAEVQDDYHRAPWVRTQPLEKSDVEPALEEPSPSSLAPADPFEQHTAEASQQRIVALRLVAPDARWNGRLLRESLEAENLHYGRYSIFHREREDGKSLFYVASMMEPGSFDLDTMDDQFFPGISLFGIVPGPLEAPAIFDLMLAAGRHLADRMKGQLQDEQGSTLTSQRILNLREELVHFEHRHKRLRRS